MTSTILSAAQTLRKTKHLIRASTGDAHPVAAGLAIGLSGGLLEDLLDMRPRLIAATGHYAMFYQTATTKESRADALSDGPCRAPSSPPETPEPTNKKPLPSSSFVRRIESG